MNAKVIRVWLFSSSAVGPMIYRDVRKVQNVDAILQAYTVVFYTMCN